MKLLKITSIEVIGEEDKYDFEIEDNENFFYNSVLVHNCRAIIRKEDMRTRENDVMTSCPHIERELADFFVNNPSVILDGELYNHDLKDDFNKIVSLVRSDTDLTPEDYNETERLIEYHVYDVFMDAPYPERYKFLQDNLSGIDGVKIVRIDVISPDKISDMFELYASMGYEGQMVRLPEYNYEAAKRSWSLLKNKEFDTNEFRIKEILPGIGNRSDIAGSIVCYLPDGREFSAGIKGSWEYAAKLLADRDKYVGGEATIRHFKYTEYGIPRFPVLIEVYAGKRNL